MLVLVQGNSPALGTRAETCRTEGSKRSEAGTLSGVLLLQASGWLTRVRMLLAARLQKKLEARRRALEERARAAEKEEAAAQAAAEAVSRVRQCTCSLPLRHRRPIILWRTCTAGFGVAPRAAAGCPAPAGDGSQLVRLP